MAYVGTKTKSPTKVDAISDENTFIWEYLGWVMKSLKDHAKNIIKTAADIIRVFEMRLSGAGPLAHGEGQTPQAQAAPSNAVGTLRNGRLP